MAEDSGLAPRGPAVSRRDRPGRLLSGARSEGRRRSGSRRRDQAGFPFWL